MESVDSESCRARRMKRMVQRPRSSEPRPLKEGVFCADQIQRSACTMYWKWERTHRFVVRSACPPLRPQGTIAMVNGSITRTNSSMCSCSGCEMLCLPLRRFRRTITQRISEAMNAELISAPTMTGISAVREAVEGVEGRLGSIDVTPGLG